MMNKMGIQIVNRWILFFLCYFSIPFLFLEASLINPDLAPKLLSHTDFGSGYEDFAKGRTYFNEENWEDAIYFFTQAIEKSYKPDFECRNYLDDEGYRHICEDYSETVDGYIVREPNYEIILAIYRHSHFYWGLIRLYQGEIPKANFHFKKAIGFRGIEDDFGLNFYKCANFIHPAWIALASLTRLYMGEAEEAESLMNMAFWTLESFEDILSGESEWSGSVLSKYWHDLTKRGIRSKKWHDMQLIMTYNTASIIASFQNDLEKAIELASQAIQTKNNAIKEKVFSGESENHFVLYYNRGMLYTKKGDYHQALLDFTKAIELNPNDPNLYFNCGNIYLDLEEYSAALSNYQQAIAIDPNNFEYYRHRALAYMMMGSIDKAKQDLKLLEIQKNKLKTQQNELGICEFSKGYFEKAINHFSQFIQLNPNLAIGYQNRGAALYQVGKLEEALNDYNEALRLDPAQADLYQMKATVLMSLPVINEEEENAYLIEARNNLLTALEINPKDAKIYQNLAASYALKGNLDAALMCYNKALALAPHQDHPYILKKLSLIYFHLGDYEKTLLHCKKAIQMECKDGEIYFIQGRCLFEKNQIEQAIENYHLAIQAGYNDVEIYFNRAKAYFCLQQFDNALDDATRVLKVDSFNTECYKLRGLVFLSKHQEQEAYSDFYMALHADSLDLFSNEKQASNSKLKLNTERMLFQFNGMTTSLDSQLIYKPRFHSQLTKESSLAQKLSQINLASFGKGLGVGLKSGGVETLKEIGPFLVNLLFHPIETTEELLTAIQFLLSKTLQKEWDAVFEALAPELKELFSTWDKIDDYHKGKLIGLFIGKNGMAALTALGAVKTVSKLKNVIVGSSKTKFSCLLKRTKPEVASLPVSELSLPTVSQDFGWHLPYEGGAVIGGRYYTEHALARMAPDTFETRAILEAKAIKKTQKLGLRFETWEEIEKWTLNEQGKSFSIDPRGIPPSVIEAEIANPGSTGGKIQVILNEKGDVVTVRHMNKNKLSGEK